ncbi:fimbrial protein [Tatumella terrea]|uniref:Fimbrial protein n=1 Tax=Tatumella terrea TaxID=419007 RepID=A0ABW1W0J2_9GAMM|nr:fimbrial protein [Tatumella sp. JGM118]MBS0910190.1 type 1 fimbrial protein [Tatumella sp. JGM118]
MQVLIRRGAGITQCAMTLLGLLIPATASAGEYPITVNFTGEYVTETCEIRINGSGNNEAVTLPRLTTTALNNSGGEGGKTGFTVTLAECPGFTTVNLLFGSDYSPADTATGNLLNQTGNDYSRNVQLRIRKEDGSQIMIDDRNTAQQYRIWFANTPVTHQFYVSYFSGNAGPVTAGKVHAIAGITVDYH